MRIYVKTGLAGYGPELDEYDEGPETYADAAYVISEELSRAADSAYELAHAVGDLGEYETAWQEIVRSEELAVLAANFSPSRRFASLYQGKAGLWESAVRDLVNANFPVDISPHDRLYVWEASE